MDIELMMEVRRARRLWRSGWTYPKPRPQVVEKPK